MRAHLIVQHDDGTPTGSRSTSFFIRGILGPDAWSIFTPALALLGFVLTDQARFGWEKDEATTYEAALEFAARALVIDPNSADAYVALGYTRLFQRRHDDASAAGEKAIALCPNGAGAYHMAAMFHGYAGDFRKAAEYEKQAQRLSPLSRNESTVDEARARFHLGDLVAARDIASRVLLERPRWLTAQVPPKSCCRAIKTRATKRSIAFLAAEARPSMEFSQCWARFR